MVLLARVHAQVPVLAKARDGTWQIEFLENPVSVSTAAEATPVAETPPDAKPTRKRRTMSAEEKNAVSERMTAYWASPTPAASSGFMCSQVSNQVIQTTKCHRIQTVRKPTARNH